MRMQTARNVMRGHQPLRKLLAARPTDAADDAFWAYMSLLRLE